MTDSFVGVDVAKGEFVVACRPDGVSWTATNDSEGIAATVARLRSLRPHLIVLEATGGYERVVVAALAAAGLPIVVAHPRQGRDFAKATGQLAKTDDVDADLLALFADRVRPTPRPAPGRCRPAVGGADDAPPSAAGHADRRAESAGDAVGPIRLLRSVGRRGRG